MGNKMFNAEKLKKKKEEHLEKYRGKQVAYRSWVMDH